MTLGEWMVDAWRQALVEDLPEATLGDRKCRVSRTRSQGLRVVSFEYEGYLIEGIEQNPEKASRWAKLAQEGKRIMQFRYRRRFISNVCEGHLMRYPSWGALHLPE